MSFVHPCLWRGAKEWRRLWRGAKEWRRLGGGGGGGGRLASTVHLARNTNDMEFPQLNVTQ